MIALQANMKRMNRDAGIAIGPILFIIAILAILAAAIAAGSGSFTGGTSAESNKTKSSALVQIGENLKLGMDQITFEGGVSIDSVDINISNTSGTAALFSPTGGGIAPPSVGMGANPIYDHWFFPRGKPTGFGSGGGNVIFAVLPVTRGVCAEANNRALGVSAVPGSAALGNFIDDPEVVSGTWPTASSVTWYAGASTTNDIDASASPTLVGVATGCVWNSDIAATVTANCTIVGADGVGTTCTAGPTSPFFFYQVLAIQ